MGSKGGGSAPTESTVTQTNLPEYAEPFYRDLLTRVGYESAVPYTPYQDRRLAYFDPAEQEAMRRFEELGVEGTAPELSAAGSIAAQVGTGSPYAETMLETTKRAQEMPGYASSFRQGNVYHGYEPATIDQTYIAGQRGTSYDARPIDQTYTAGQRGMYYDPGTLEQGYQARGRHVGYDPGTLTDPEQISQYMSPYQQLVTDREKEEARRQSEIMGQQIGTQAAGAGSLGGYREAIMQAERQRNLEDQLGDIQAAGSQQAYQLAMQGMEADRAARGQLETFAQQQFAQNEANKQRQMQFAADVFAANQQAQQQAEILSQQQFAQNEANRQQQMQFNLAAYQAEEQARQQAETFAQQQFAQNEANRQQQMQFNLAAYQAGEQARQQAAQLGLSAQEQEQRGRMAEEEARRAAHQMNLEQARAAATLGQQAYGQVLSGDQQRLAAAGLLGDFAQQRQGMEMERLRAMQTAGQIQRELAQRGLDIGYADFLRQQAYPKEQLSFYSSMLQGIPIAPGQVSQAYGVTPSMTQQLLGSGIAGVGLYNALR